MSDPMWIGPPGQFSVTYILSGGSTGGRFAVIEHTIAPGILGGPPHVHHGEDEFSYVLDGVVGFQLGSSTRIARAGDLVSKPRDQLHTFWNASEVGARVLEMISPAGFERYFDELAALVNATTGAPAPDDLLALASKYHLEIDIAAIGQVVGARGVKLPGM